MAHRRAIALCVRESARTSLRISQVSIYLAPHKTYESHATSPPRLNGPRRLTGSTGISQRLADSRATMTESAGPNDNVPATGEPAQAPPPPPKRSPGHRGQDVRDTVAELAQRAHEISLEAGSKMSGALRDVIGAAAGLTAFAVESARDLVQYMVRRGQMTQEEADKLIREAEEANSKRGKTPKTDAAKKPGVEARAKAPAKPKVAAAAPVKKPAAPVAKKPAPAKKPAAKK